MVVPDNSNIIVYHGLVLPHIRRRSVDFLYLLPENCFYFIYVDIELMAISDFYIELMEQVAYYGLGLLILGMTIISTLHIAKRMDKK